MYMYCSSLSVHEAILTVCHSFMARNPSRALRRWICSVSRLTTLSLVAPRTSMGTWGGEGQALENILKCLTAVYTVRPLLTDTPSSGYLQYNGQQLMYQLLFL